MFSRGVIGQSVAAHIRTELVSSALEVAVATNGGSVDGVVFHSDRWSQGIHPVHLGPDGELREHLGVAQSMAAIGVCWDSPAGEESLPRYRGGHSTNSICESALRRILGVRDRQVFARRTALGASGHHVGHNPGPIEECLEDPTRH